MINIWVVLNYNDRNDYNNYEELFSRKFSTIYKTRSYLKGDKDSMR